MKLRLGFVSNSSSSSFVTIGCGSLNIPSFDSYELNVPEDFGGCLEFGWGPEDYNDFGTRLNFAYMQTTYAGLETDPLYVKALEANGEHVNKWLHMLETILKNRLNVNQINWNLGDDNDDDSKKRWAYIDHQSAAGEGVNTEMFDNIDTLEHWLFSDDSEIHLDNDNH